jgi:hypothetical protein
MLSIGRFQIKSIVGTNMIWLIKDDGEGMQVSRDGLFRILEAAINRYWEQIF